jgi:hypothetical protein
METVTMPAEIVGAMGIAIALLAIVAIILSTRW